MTESSNSTDCVMSNSSYSSDSVVNKSEDEISVFFVVFHICLCKKFICHFFSQFVAFFIPEYGMTESSNSTDCVMGNSSYSSDGVMNKSEDEVSVAVIYFKSIFYKFVHNFVCHIINFFISKNGMAESSNSTNCVMSNSSYSSDSVVDKSEDEVVFSFAFFSLENVLYHLFG